MKKLLLITCLLLVGCSSAAKLDCPKPKTQIANMTKHQYQECRTK